MTEADPLLAAVAPLGLAAAASTALVVDLSEWPAAYPGRRTLAEVCDEGPTQSELTAPRSGIAVLANGGIDPVAALDTLTLLSSRWPAVVVRVDTTEFPFPVIPVRLLLPGFLAPVGGHPAVWQRCPSGSPPPGPGPVLPPPSRATVSALIDCRLPWRSRWVRAWRQVWELPWR